MESSRITESDRLCQRLGAWLADEQVAVVLWSDKEDAHTENGVDLLLDVGRAGNVTLWMDQRRQHERAHRNCAVDRRAG